MIMMSPMIEYPQDPKTESIDSVDVGGGMITDDGWEAMAQAFEEAERRAKSHCHRMAKYYGLELFLGLPNDCGIKLSLGDLNGIPFDED